MPSGVAQQVVGVEQGVGDFRALLQAAADGGEGIAWRVLRQSPGCSSKRMRMPRIARLAEGRGDPQRMPSCSSMRRSRCSRSSRLRRASRRAARRCSSWRVREEDATVRAGRLQGARVRERRRRAGRAGGGAGKRSWHHHSQDRRPAPLRPSPPRARFSASARLPCCSRPLRMA